LRKPRERRSNGDSLGKPPWHPSQEYPSFSGTRLDTKCLFSSRQAQLRRQNSTSLAQRKLNTTDLVGALLSLVWLRTMSFGMPSFQAFVMKPQRYPAHVSYLLSFGSRMDVCRKLGWMPDQVRHDGQLYSAFGRMTSEASRPPTPSLRPPTPSLRPPTPSLRRKPESSRRFHFCCPKG